MVRTASVFFVYQTRVAKYLFHSAVKNNTVRELAFLVAVKRHTSTLKGKNLSRIHISLGEIAGCSSATARRYLTTLEKMGAATVKKRNGFVYVNFVRIRARKMQDKKRLMWWTPRDRDIKLNPSVVLLGNYKEIELALLSNIIVDTQQKRDYLTQTAKLARDPEKGTPAKVINQAKKQLRRYGIEDFVDRGMSNSYLRKKLHCGTATLKNVVALGESVGLFTRIPPTVEYIRVNKGCGQEAFDYTDGEYTFYTHSYVAIVDGATRYALG